MRGQKRGSGSSGPFLVSQAPIFPTNMSGLRASNGQPWGQEVKDHGHRRLKLYLEAWRRHYSQPLQASR